MSSDGFPGVEKRDSSEPPRLHVILRGRNQSRPGIGPPVVIRLEGRGLERARSASSTRWRYSFTLQAPLGLALRLEIEEGHHPARGVLQHVAVNQPAT